MARAHTKCKECGDILWFDDNDPVPQEVVCPCGETKLREDGPKGQFRKLTAKEAKALA